MMWALTFVSAILLMFFFLPRITAADDEERDRAAQGIVLLMVASMVIAFGLMATSCKTTTKVVTEYRDREVIKTELAHDSIFIRDSVWMRTQNDTIFIDKVRTEYAYRLLTKVDSFVRIDSIPYIQEVEVVKYRRSNYDRFCSFAFWAILLAFTAVLGFKIYKRLHGLR